MSKNVSLVVVFCYGTVVGGMAVCTFNNIRSSTLSGVANERKDRMPDKRSSVVLMESTASQLPPEVIEALTEIEDEDPGTSAKDRNRRIDMVKYWLRLCRHNGSLPEHMSLIKAYMARFELSWEEVGSSSQEIRDMWFQRSLELLGGARDGSRAHLHQFRQYISAAPEYVTLDSLGTSQKELDFMDQEFARKYGP